MTDEKEITGWVAWHPDPTRKPECRAQTFSSFQAGAWERLLLNYITKEEPIFVVTEFVRLQAQGWRIRPCKIVFTDEVEK